MPPQQTPSPELEPEVQSVQPSPDLPEMPGQKNKKTLYVLLAVLLVALIGAGGYFAFLRKDTNDTPAQSQQQPKEEDQAQNQADEPEGCDEGLAEFKSDNIGLRFCYPVAWGNASMETGQEQQAGHLEAGNEYRIGFSKNDSVYAGFKSKDWKHNDMGHDGGEANGTIDFTELKQAKEYVKAAYIYEDTDAQFSYIHDCIEFCQRGEPRVQLTYGVKIPENDKYELIVFYQDGPEFGKEFMESPEKDPSTSYVSYDKVQAADLTQLLPKADILFVTLRQVAQTVKN